MKDKLHPLSMEAIQELVKNKKWKFDDFTTGDYLFEKSDHPGMICKIYRNGTREHGRWIENSFVPDPLLTEIGDELP